MTTARTPVCIFAKPPRPGEVKTRLAADVGLRRAADLARGFLFDTRAAVERLPWATPMLATTGALDDALSGNATVWDQGGGELGHRLARVLARARVGHDAAIAIGADSPALPATVLDDARQRLRDHDAVLGPADDGGFYLLGVRRDLSRLLDGVRWSAPTTAAEVEGRLRGAGWSIARIAPWFDVDDAASLRRLERVLIADPAAAPVTAELLARRISVVIPALDEERRIGGQLDRLAATAGLREVVVVDGGSRDRTRAIAAAHAGVRVVEAARGRGAQLDAGVRAAWGEIVLFLHADVTLPADAVAHVTSALRDPDVVGGAFRTWTVPDDMASERRIAPLLHLADLRSRYTRLPYGDQAIFARARELDAIGGVPAMPILEDVELARRLRARGALVTVPARVQVSGRRFLARPIYYTALVNLIPALYRLGVPATALARLYGAVR